MISIYFGSPGAGKTTLACREVKKANRRYAYTFTNYGCSCADFDDVSLDKLGEWTFPPGSFISVDEAGIIYNNRKFKSFPAAAIQWYKLHRHYGCDMAIYSQALDIDVTLFRLADRLYYIKKIGPFTLQRRVYKFVTVDEESKQIIDGFKMVPMAYLLLRPLYLLSYLLFGLGFLVKLIFPKFTEVRLIWRRPYYKYFDTHAAPDLPQPFDLSSARVHSLNASPTARLNVVLQRLRWKATELALRAGWHVANIKRRLQLKRK